MTKCETKKFRAYATQINIMSTTGWILAKAGASHGFEEFCVALHQNYVEISHLIAKLSTLFRILGEPFTSPIPVKTSRCSISFR